MTTVTTPDCRSALRRYNPDKKVGPLGAATPNSGPGRPDKEVDVGNILPHGTDNTEPPPETAWMARLDGCPSACGNTELPTGVSWTPDGFLAHYVCESCGVAWSTAWKEPHA